MVSRSQWCTTEAYGWKEANHFSLTAPSDQVLSESTRQFLLETEGKQIPMLRYKGSSKSIGETNYNVVKTRTENVVERTSTVPAAYLFKMYKLPPWDHDEDSNSRDFGVDDEDHRHRCRHPACPDFDFNHQVRHNNYSDEIFEELIKRVRDEAQRRGTTYTTTNKPADVAVPSASAWRLVPPKPRNHYVQEANIFNNPKYEAPNNNYAGNGHSLSKPTNQVSTAMGFLKEAIKPSNGKEKEIIGLINNSSAYTDSRPAAVPKSSTSDPYSHQITTTAPWKKKGPAAPEKEYENQGIITSREAQKIYNGVFVP